MTEARAQQDPYATPSAATSFAGISGCHREGSLLAVTDGAVLPPVCPVTSRPVNPSQPPQEIRLAWTPPWIFLTGVLGVIPMFVLMALLTKKATVSGYLSPSIVRRTKFRKRSSPVLFAAGAGLFVTGILKPDLFMLGATGVMLAIASIFVFLLAGPLVPSGYRKGVFLISGRPPRFLKALPSAPPPPPFPVSSADATATGP